MSTRYVWDKCSIRYTESVKELSNFDLSAFEGGSKLYGSNMPPDGTVSGYASTGYTRNSDGTYNLSGTIIELVCGGNETRITNQSYKYMAISRTNNICIVYLKYWRSSKMYITGSYKEKDSKYWLTIYWEDTSAPMTAIYQDIYIRTPEAGSVLERRSGSSSSAYPTGQSGGYWYTYKGSDSIDPIAISYSNLKPRAGETVTVTVTPAKNTYGGTISYQYQYSINGGSTWTNSGDKTTSTTKVFTIAKGTTQFRVRAVASDNYGFTSSTYVTGANLPVTSMLTYVGIGGKARKLGKIYVGVNGKAREVVKGYVGDANGKARSLF